MNECLAMIVALALASHALAAATTQPVSYFRDVKPLLMANCNACHKPDKMKAELDMTTYAALMKGGKHGKTVVSMKADDSRLIEEITGDDPSMPKDGDPLKPVEVALITRWVQEGAKDDSPAPGMSKVEAPVYAAAPSITALAFSPDGSLLVVGGYHEVLLQKGDGSGLAGRLLGECARIESLAFSKDGKLLAVAGGSPAEFGQVQIWDVATRKNLKTFQPSTDSLYGISFSPDGKTIACGAADKIVRRINIGDGKVLTEFKAHSDWVLATCFTLDGKQIVSAGRDKAIKLIDGASGRFVDDINNPLEQVLCMSRAPAEDKVLYGGDLGNARLYKISDNQARTAGRVDTNLLASYERQPGAVNAIAFSPDGQRVALGSTGEVRVYPAADNVATGYKRSPKVKTNSAAQLIMSGNSGAVFGVAWKGDGTVIATAGADGIVRLFDAETGELIKQFSAVPIGVTAMSR